MGKDYKLQLLRLLLWRPVSLGFNSFPPSYTDSEEKWRAPVRAISVQFQWSIFHSPIQNRIRNLQLCLLPSALLFS